MFNFFNIQKFFIWCAYMFKVICNFFNPKNYEVLKASLVYYVNDEPSVPKLKFWREEYDNWMYDNTEHWVDVSNEYFNGTLGDIIVNVPSEVSDVTLRLNYTYNGKKYKYISYDYPAVWPPKSAIGFKVPIKEARLVGKDDTLDVTNKIKRYAGPNHDFHGTSVKVYDLFFILVDTYKYLEVTNVLGQTKYYDINQFLQL